MHIEINPDLIELRHEGEAETHDPDRPDTVYAVYYAGHRAPDVIRTGRGVPASHHQTLATLIVEQMIEGMSAHERLALSAAVHAEEDVDWSKAVRATFPNLKRSDGDAD